MQLLETRSERGNPILQMSWDEFVALPTGEFKAKQVADLYQGRLIGVGLVPAADNLPQACLGVTANEALYLSEASNPKQALLHADAVLEGSRIMAQFPGFSRYNAPTLERVVLCDISFVENAVQPPA